MTDIDQVSDDLKFVRQAVDRKDRPPRSPAGILWLWAMYVLIGYVMIDFPQDTPIGSS